MTVIKEIAKILLTYFFSTIAFYIGLVVISDEIDFTTNTELKRAWIAVILFTIIFLGLIKLLKLKFETVAIFLAIIMFFLFFLILNKGFFETYLWSTPDDLKFPIISFISILVTIPFQGIIWTLVGFNMVKITEVILLMYMVFLGLTSYFLINFRINKFS